MIKNIIFIFNHLHQLMTESYLSLLPIEILAIICQSLPKKQILYIGQLSKFNNQLYQLVNLQNYELLDKYPHTWFLLTQNEAKWNSLYPQYKIDRQRLATELDNAHDLIDIYLNGKHIIDSFREKHLMLPHGRDLSVIIQFQLMESTKLIILKHLSNKMELRDTLTNYRRYKKIKNKEYAELIDFLYSLC